MRELRMGCERVIPTVAVGRVPVAVAWYRNVLGCRELWTWGDPPVHAAVSFDDVEIHLSSGRPNPGGAWLYLIVSDVDRLRAELERRGVEIEHAPFDEEWGMREMTVRDLVGNEIIFAEALVSPETAAEKEPEALELQV